MSAASLGSADPDRNGASSWFGSKNSELPTEQDLSGQFAEGAAPPPDLSIEDGASREIVDLSTQADTGVTEIVEQMVETPMEDYGEFIRSLTWIEEWTMRFPSPLGWVGSRVLDAHEMLGLEWWASFAAVSVLFRAAYLPIAIQQQAMGSRSRTIQVATKQSTKLLQEVASGSNTQVDPQVRLEQFRQMAEMRKKAGVSPLRMLMPMFVLLPGSIFLFQGIRLIAEQAHRIPGMDSGGLPWAPDLSVPDPYCILPALSLVGAGISAAITRQTNAEMARYSPPAINPNTLFTGLLGMQAAFAPIMATFPLGLQILFASTSWTLMLTPLLARQPFIHRMFGFAPGWPNHVKQIPPAGMTQHEADLKALEMAEESAAQFLPYMGGFQGVAQRFTRRKGQADGADNPNYVGLFGMHDAGPPPPPLHVVASTAGSRMAAAEAAGNAGAGAPPQADVTSAKAQPAGAGGSGSPGVRRKRRKGGKRR